MQISLPVGTQHSIGQLIHRRNNLLADRPYWAANKNVLSKTLNLIQRGHCQSGIAGLREQNDCMKVYESHRSRRPLELIDLNQTVARSFVIP